MAKQSFTFKAETRHLLGKGASRRLRQEGKVPGVIYGAHLEPISITLIQKDVIKALENEAVFSHLLDLTVGDETQKVVLKDLQRHPFKPRINHIDFQRISMNEKLTMNVPLHFVGDTECPGVEDNGVISHLITEVEIRCLPINLPEFIEVDTSKLQLDEAIHLSQIKLPTGVELAHPPIDDLHDHAIVNVHLPRKSSEDIAAETAELESSAAASAAAQPVEEGTAEKPE